MSRCLCRMLGFLALIVFGASFRALSNGSDEWVSITFEKPKGTDVEIELVCSSHPEVEGAYFLRIEKQDGVSRYVYQLKEYTMTLKGGGITAMDLSRSSVYAIDVTHLPNLKELRLEGNNIESIDLSACKNLEILDLGDNRLSDITLTGLTKLQRLLVNGNGIGALDVSNCAELILLACYNNSLYPTAVENLVRSMPTVTNGKTGRIIAVDTSNAMEENNFKSNSVKTLKEKNWEVFDFKGDPQLMEPYRGSDYVPVVSSNRIQFKTRLLADDEIKLMWKTTADNENVTLEGASVARIENYGNGPVYVCKLSASEVTIYGDLTMFDCSDNLITELDPSGCPLLEELYCHKNGYIETLDLAKLPALRRLITTDCSLKSIDLSQNGLLEEAYLANMPIDKLDLSSNKALKLLVLNKTSLAAIDLSANTQLRELRLSNTPIQTLDLAPLKDLKNLYIANNNLQTLDLSGNSKIERLRVNGNKLANLNLSHLTNLYELYLFENEIKAEAFFSIMEGLPSVSKGKIPLVIAIDSQSGREKNVCTTLAVAKAREKGWSVYDFNGDSSSKMPYEGSRPQEQSYVAFTSELPVGERIFVVSRTEDGAPVRVEGLCYENTVAFDGETIDTYRIENKDMRIYGELVYLNLQENYLTSVDITRASKLQELKLSSNPKLNSLDLSKGDSLHKLILSSTGIKELNLSQTPRLQELYAASLPIKSIDLSVCKNLKKLNLNATEVSSIDLTHCPNLTYLTMTGLAVEDLDVSNCPQLEYLYFSDCKVTSIDLSKNGKLKHLWCSNNKLSRLNVSEAKELDHLYCYNNEIGEQAMGELVISMANRGSKEEGTFVPVDKKSTQEKNYCTKEQVNDLKLKNWNTYNYNGGQGKLQPYQGEVAVTSIDAGSRLWYDAVSNRLVAEGLTPYAELKVFDLDGVCLRSLCTDNCGCLCVSLAELPRGIYLVSSKNTFVKVVK